MDHFAFLRKVYFFRDLADDDIEELASLCKEAEFPDGEVIFREGDQPENFYVVTDGQVEVWKDWGSADADRLAVHGAGHLFGEMALVDDMPRSATVIAKGRTRTLYLYKKEFSQFVRRNSVAAISVMRSLSSMVRKSNESFVEDLRAQNEELERRNEELREAQQELLRRERLSTLGRFSSMILHDIRNPISILKSYGEMIVQRSDNPDRVAEYGRRIIREADRMNALAGELLDYSKGEIRLDTTICQVDRLLERVQELLSERTASRGIELQVENRVEMPVIIDEERMTRVLYNLCDNARKASRRGGTIALQAEAADGSIVFRVRDHGEGMEPETLQHIFEPFYSISQQGGTGLGMVIVKNVVEAHDGSLDISSTPGTGTEVSITLPHRV